MAASKARTKFRSALVSPKNELVLPELRRHVIRAFNSKDVDRDQSRIHVSELSRDDWCARRAWLRISGREQDAVPSLSWGISNVYQEGNYVQLKYEHWFWEMGILWGQFACMDCGHRFFAQSPESCEVCDGRLEYKEVPFTADKYLISGHIDMALMLDPSPVLIEVKTVGLGTIRIEAPALYSGYAEGVRTLDQLLAGVNRPFPTHRKQGGMYITLVPAIHRQLKDAESIQFLYEFKANQDVKEFGLTAEKAAEEVGPLLEEAREVEIAIRTGREIEHPPWANKDGGICAACPMRTACWGGDVVEQVSTVAKKASAVKRRKALGSAK